MSQRWKRRAITVSATGVAALVFYGLLPALLLCSLTLDTIAPKRLARTRGLLFVGWLLTLECLGIAAATANWLYTGGGYASETFLRHNMRLQYWWCSTLTAGLKRLFSVAYEFTGSEHLEAGPLFLFIRHVSTADTLLPITEVALPHAFRTRYVLKSELQWDPCLDIVGNRLQNAFIRRGQGASEVESIRKLAQEIDPSTLIVLYPEGTRFSESRRERRLQQLRDRSDPKLGLAEQMTHTLPPHVGGPLALLEEQPHVDVVFFAHAGLEGIRTVADLFNGTLIGRSVKGHFWRVSAKDIPKESTQQQLWLFEQWLQVDEWVGKHPPSAK
ncbi:MAG: 1-acyl-sn-glycerol-3-phosphate acyltransferase [Myxococcota bacterium]|nr:1-acyl-sn-glycerol-3-phosphate acyltransferase [Myxococcota bacterium]